MYINRIVLYVVFIVVAILCGLVVYLDNKARSTAEQIIYTVEQDGISTKHYYEREFSSLKKENKELYDSLKRQKKEIESLLQFRYKKKYATDTVYVEKKEPLPEVLSDLPDNTYTYNSETDTLTYKLEVNSKTEPNWYRLSAEVNDKFTVVNKNHGDGNQSTSIESQNGEVFDITAWQKANKKKWHNKFSFGPTVSIGYDPVNRNAGVVIGVGITYNIWEK